MSVLKSIREAIKNEGNDPSKLVELNLAQIEIGEFTPEVKNAIEECKNLQILILTECGLTSLNNLPELDLTAIDLTANKLTDSALEKLTRYQNLGQLILNENNIEKLESIKQLSKLENLQQLDLSENPVTQVDKYREFVFENLTKLQILDRFDRDGNEQVEEDQFVDDEDDEDDQFDDDEDDDDEDEEFDEDEESEQQRPPAKKKK